MSRTYDRVGHLVETTQDVTTPTNHTIKADYFYDPMGHVIAILDSIQNQILLQVLFDGSLPPVDHHLAAAAPEPAASEAFQTNACTASTCAGVRPGTVIRLWGSTFFGSRIHLRAKP